MKPQDRKMWIRIRKGCSDPHFASASTGLKPENVSVELFGHHASVVPQKGTRVYMFNGKKNRDRFVDFHKHREAKVCQDPL